MSRAIILDCASPLAALRTVDQRAVDSSLLFVTDGRQTATWLTRVLGREVDALLSVSRCTHQEAIERFIGAYCSGMEVDSGGINLGPSAEYLLLLAVVSTARDLAVLKELRSRSVSVERVTILTDRMSADGFRSALDMSISGVVDVVPVPGIRYGDGLVRTYRAAWGRQRAMRMRLPLLPRESGPYALATPRDANVLRNAGTTHLPLEWVVEDPAALALHLGTIFQGSSNRRVLERADAAARAATEPIVDWLAARFGLESGIVRVLASDNIATAISLSLRCAHASVVAHLPAMRTRRPTAVLVWNDVLPQHRALVDLARSMDVRTVTYQHGIFALKTMHDSPRTDVVAVWGPSSERWLAGVGVSADRIRMVGSPFGRHSTSTERVSGASTRPRLLYASQPNTGFIVTDDLAEPQRLLYSIAEACRENGYELTAKPHPAETYSGWEMAVNASFPEVTVQPDVSMVELLQSADVLVTRSSTSVIEALLQSVPPVVLSSPEAGVENPYAQLPGITSAASPVNLRTAVESAMLEESVSRDAALLELAGPIDDRAGIRLVKLLQEGAVALGPL